MQVSLAEREMDGGMVGENTHTHTHAHSSECTYICTSNFVMGVVAGKWSLYDAGISEFCLKFHIPGMFFRKKKLYSRAEILSRFFRNQTTQL